MILWLWLLAACGRRGRPAPAQAADTIAVEAIRPTASGVEVTLACPPLSDVRAEVAVWRGEVAVATGASDGCTVPVHGLVAAEGERLRLTGSIVGSYGWGQRVVLVLDASREVEP